MDQFVDRSITKSNKYCRTGISKRARIIIQEMKKTGEIQLLTSNENMPNIVNKIVGKYGEINEKVQLGAVTKWLCLIDMRKLIKGIKLKLWSKNRKINLDRVNEIYVYQLECIKKYKTVVFTPSNIVLCVIGDIPYIIDGQHRVEAIKMLLRTPTYNNPIYMTCELFTGCNNIFIESIFQVVNLAEPVPVNIVACNDNVNALCRLIVQKINRKYPNIVTNKRGYRPKINEDTLSTVLSKIIFNNELYLKSPEKLWDDIIKINDRHWHNLHNKDFVNIMKQNDPKLSDKMVKNALNKRFVLSLNLKWFYDVSSTQDSKESSDDFEYY